MVGTLPAPGLSPEATAAGRGVLGCILGSALLAASVWGRTEGQREGGLGTPARPELIRPVAFLGDVFCVEKSRETSWCGAQSAWRRTPGTGAWGPPFALSLPGPSWLGSRTGEPEGGGGLEGCGEAPTEPQTDAGGFSGVGAAGGRVPLGAEQPAASQRQFCGTSSSCQAGLQGSQAVASLPEHRWPSHPGAPAFVVRCPGKAQGSWESFL